MKHFLKSVCIYSFALTLLLHSEATAQTTTNPNPTITPTTDCKSLYPNDTPSDVNLRSICENIKSAGGDPAKVQDALQELDSTKEGVYGCNGMGQYGPVGQRKASGTYVPVSEEAVALNTYILVNKFCVLDAIARNNRNALVAGLERAQVKAINEGRDGKPQYVQDIMRLYRHEIPTRVVENILKSKEVQGMCEPMRDSLIRSVAQRFYQDQTQPENRITCSFQDQQKLRALYEQGRIDLVGWEGFQQSLEENNHPFLLRLALNDYIDATVSNEVERQREELSFGNGFFSKKKCEQVPVGNGITETQCNIVTPGEIVAQSASYLALSGNRMVESADEINKMVGTLFANLSSQILASSTGFSGTTQSLAGAPSYLDTAANNAYQTAQTETLTTGVEALQKAISLETTYVSVRTNSKQTLETTKTQITNLQNTCMGTLIAQAKSDLKKQVNDAECAAQSGDPNTLNPSCSVSINVTDTLVDGVTVIDAKGPTIRKIAAIKAPEKASGIITNTIQPMLDIVTTSLANAQKGLAILKQMEQSVRGATTPQLVAYVVGQLNQLISAKVLHDEAGVSTAREQNTRISDTMQSLVDRTKEEWEADWCQAAKWQTLVVSTPTSYK